jgi:nucleoside-diphosphate-sugar epimerase
MTILGTGMMAHGFAAHASELERAIVFARGVSDSSCADGSQFARERAALQEALAGARSSGRTLVYFSTGKVYGDARQPRAEDAPMRPISPYAAHKAACETEIRDSGVVHLILRLPNVVGPGQNSAQLVPALHNQALAGRVRLLRDAERDILHIDDVAGATVRLIEAGTSHETVNVASGHSVPVTEIYRELATLLRLDAKADVVPGGEAERFVVRRLAELTGLTFAREHYRAVLAKYAASFHRA